MNKNLAIKFPTSPGVYLHKNAEGDVIYVGKAKSLRKRVASYFSKQDHDNKTHILVQNISSTDYIVTNNEIEALLLENRLIKKYKPKFNIELKDSTRYTYIQITKEEFPRVLVTRKTNKKDKFFGPYTVSVSDIKRIIRDSFKLRRCNRIMPKKACIYHDLNLCDAPCEKKVSKEEYKRRVDEVVHLIRHGDKQLKENYKKEMLDASKELNFEKALELKKRIELLNKLHQKQVVDLMQSSDQDAIGIATQNDKANVTVLKIKKGVILHKESFTFLSSDDLLSEFLKIYYSKLKAPSEIIVHDDFDKSISKYLSDLWEKSVQIVLPKKGVKLDLVNLAQKNAYAKFNLEDKTLIEMKEILKLNSIPYIIECFDISNYGDSVIVGACVQFKNKEPLKAEWRHYNINGDFGQDDFRSIHEVVKRRYEKHKLPDLIIVDGGDIQVDFAKKALDELGLSCPIVGLAKKEETLIFPDGISIKLNRRLESSKLIIRIRDAVHKFAIGFSRNKFKKKYKKSVLDEIPGIGEATKFALLSSFGSIEKIKDASLDELLQVVDKKRAKIVFEFFSK